jgi:hypothetical protein
MHRDLDLRNLRVSAGIRAVVKHFDIVAIREAQKRLGAPPHVRPGALGCVNGWFSAHLAGSGASPQAGAVKAPSGAMP